jgi:tetratricopeptide (TPR) repeat protein
MPSKKVEQFDAIMNEMAKTKEALDEEERLEGSDAADPQDRLLSQAIELAIQQGRGWAPGEKEAYLAKILDDDYIPPLFASTAEEVERSGLQDAFTSLLLPDGESPTTLMLQCKKKAAAAYANGKMNQAGNVQYYRDAVNHYIEALEWAKTIVPMQEGDYAQADDTTDDVTFTPRELDEQQSILCCNIALMHLKLKNWGHVRDYSNQALALNDQNTKAWYHLAKALQMLQHWEEAGDAIDKGLSLDEKNVDLKKLQRLLADKVRKARTLRQQRERARAERVAAVKQVWKHCNSSKNANVAGATNNKKIQLGRVALVATVTDDEEDDADVDRQESRWHQHLPNSGVLPTLCSSLTTDIDGSSSSSSNNEKEWSWPCMFLYPSHNHSDFVKHFGESEMLAMRMAELFPEPEQEGGETILPWDYNNEFTCSELAVYFEVHQISSSSSSTSSSSNDTTDVIHPDSVEPLKDQASCMRFYESMRALKGDEGIEMANVVRAVERKHLYQQRKAWKRKHGSLWHMPDPAPVVRVHPAMTLGQVLRDDRFVVVNFMVTFIIFPNQHPAHEAFLKEHKFLGILQPPNMQG